jgi:hypothetical protein
MIREELKHLAVSINQIHEHPQNVRQGDVGAIVESMKAHGQYRPIVYQHSTGRILAGNHTYKAAKALGWTEIAATPIVCDDQQALRILLVDNRTNDLSTYDQGELIELLKELSETDMELLGTGYDGDDLDQFIADLEGSVQPEENPYVQHAKIPQYEIQGNKPPISRLIDKAQAIKLLAEIDESDAPADVKDFLRVAATRHYVFDYAQIAEFYAHAEPDVQRLMERSVLVIIDIDDAIANGYAKFNETIEELMRRDGAYD